MAAHYDQIGKDYTARRSPDPRIENAISARLGTASRILNIGAGAGAYEPRDREVVAVEPVGERLAMPGREAGVVEWKANEGAALGPGDLLATLELENPENVTMVSTFEGNLQIKGWGSTSRPANAQALARNP